MLHQPEQAFVIESPSVAKMRREERAALGITRTNSDMGTSCNG